MRLTALILMVSLMHVTAASIAQKISLSEKNAPINKIFDQISKQTGYDFLVTRAMITNAKPVDIVVKNQELESVLKKIFEDQPLTYTIRNKSVVVSRKETSILDKVIAVFTNVDIEGTVVDSLGVSLPGATIRLKGSSKRVTTDRQGFFRMVDVPLDGTIQVSYLGYTTKNVKVSQGVRTIVLRAENKMLDEITVTNGYQQIETKNLSSAIDVLKAKDVVVPGMFSIDQALEGRVAGLTVMNTSGDIGTVPKIRIRGTSTVLGNHEPLWVVDGVVVNDPVNIDPSTINDLDFVNRLGNSISGLKPFDVETITILKDASATALYGVRAANGVIVITTKKGHIGEPIINFSSATTFSPRPRYTDKNINIMDSRQRVDYSRDLINNNVAYPTNINYVGYEGALHDLYTNAISFDQFQQQVSAMETRNTDWFGLIAQDAISTQNDISISGGTDKMRYYGSLGAANQTGNVKGDRINQYTAFIKLNSRLSNNLTWDINFRANVSKKNFVATNVDAIDYAYNTNRAISAYNEDGSLNYYQKYGVDYLNFNILNEIDQSRDISNLSGINLTNSFGYRISPDLKAALIFSYALNNTDQRISYGETTWYSAQLRRSNAGVAPDPSQTVMPFGGELQSNITRNYNYLVRPQFDYNKTFGKNLEHELVATIGGELSSTKYDGSATVNRGYLPERGGIFATVNPLTYPAYAVWALENPIKITDQLTNLLSGYFTTSYTFKHKYTINFNTRTDYSNNFGSRSNEKFLPSYSVSGRWDVAQDFFKKSQAINMLAFRGSYGIQGNMLPGQTPELIMKNGGLNPVRGEYSSTIAYYPNPNLKWEKTGQFNGALDFSLFGNKVNGSFSYYYKKTDNAFVNAAVSDVNGLDSYVVNAGTVTNRGIEITLSFTPINNALKGGKGFVWRIDPEIGQAINSLVNSKSVNTATVNSNTYINYLNGSQVIDGKSINSFYSYSFAGLNPVNGAPLFNNDQNTPENILKLKGLTSDQLYQYVMVPSGNRIPTLQGGLSNYFAYKSFSLSFNIAYSIGSRLRLNRLFENNYGPNASISTMAAMPEDNVNTQLLNRWRKPGDEAFTNIPGLLNPTDYAYSRTHFSSGQSYAYATNIWQMYDASDVRTASGNFLRIKTWSFRYAMSDAFCKKSGLKMASISLAGTNLFTLASKDLRGQDPEQTGFTTSNQLPIRPSFSMGIDISL